MYLLASILHLLRVAKPLTQLLTQFGQLML
jgi:hypothetical protein